MSMIIKELSVGGGCGAQKKGTPYLKDRAIILLKTHIEKMSDNGLAIISMKIKGLFDSCHYVYENKPTWLKLQIENRDGGMRPERLVFCPFDRFSHLPEE